MGAWYILRINIHQHFQIHWKIFSVFLNRFFFRTAIAPTEIKDYFFVGQNIIQQYKTIILKSTIRYSETRTMPVPRINLHNLKSEWRFCYTLEEATRTLSRASFLKEFDPTAASPEAVYLGFPILTSPFTIVPLPRSAPRKAAASSVMWTGHV